ncbi:MAG: rhodanese-like domain-containing protein [Actinomycetia bacterium]|nr:rhodanese-like domain-containing protein [Actinomycetes bacterium]
MLSSPPNTIEHVPAHEWETWRDERDAVLIDVREPMEWASTGTLPGAELISLASLPAAAEMMDRSTPVLIVCATGARSTTAAAWLTSMGFDRPASLAGGIVALGMR